MREELLKSFDEVYVLDLHGSLLLDEKTPDGRHDENVFDIRPGVAITILVKNGGNSQSLKINHADFWGTRTEKYQLLLDNDVSTMKWQEIIPSPPHIFFVPQDLNLHVEYSDGFSTQDIFTRFATGTGTGRDKSFVAFSRETIEHIARDLESKDIDDDEITRKYDIQN
jgi:predicted helicase